MILSMPRGRCKTQEPQYLAWFLTNPADPSSERWLRCLLCEKCVQDERHHSDVPEASKDHKENAQVHDAGKFVVSKDNGRKVEVSSQSDVYLAG